MHGLSFLLTARRGDRERTVLFDTGPEEYAFERNATRLDAPLASIDGIMLSHRHWDHCGAVFVALNSARQWSARTVPVYVHPQMFRTRHCDFPTAALACLTMCQVCRTCKLTGQRWCRPVSRRHCWTACFIHQERFRG
ncbi:MAG: MBL fold metallo-hydrolase [Pseudonocardiaceae bacterium]